MVKANVMAKCTKKTLRAVSSRDDKIVTNIGKVFLKGMVPDGDSEKAAPSTTTEAM